MKFQTLLLAIVSVALFASCCTNNRKSKEAALQTALVIEAEADYVLANNLIDPRALATKADGTFDYDACIEHSKMLELFIQETPALAAALRAWAQDEDVQEFTPEEVDHSVRCKP